MSRLQLAIAICATITLHALVALIVFAMQPDPSDPFAECYNWIGVKDQECSYRKSVRALRGY